MQRVFITRKLEENSPLRKLRKQGFEVFGDSLLLLQYIAFEPPESFDWLFFYSQHGARAFFEQVDPTTISTKKVAAFGPKTAAIVEEFVPCQFIGNGRGIDTAAAFEWVAKDSRTVFARAKHSMRSVQQRLVSIEVMDLVTYHNSIKPDIHVADHDIAVLTSPLNAQSYLSATEPRGTQRFIAIGESTKSVLVHLGIEEVHVPEKSSEESIVDLILQLESQ